MQGLVRMSFERLDPDLGKLFLLVTSKRYRLGVCQVSARLARADLGDSHVRRYLGRCPIDPKTQRD